MCVASMIMDHFYDKWQQPQPLPPLMPPAWPTLVPPWWPPPISPAEVDEFRKLLDRAREYDKRTGQEACELEEKKSRLKKLAAELGVDINFVDEEVAGGK